MSGWTFKNTKQPVPSHEELASSFTVRAPPSTDIWAKPPSTYRFSAPILYKTMPLASFQRARVRVSAKWTTLYDQGGLILALNRPSEHGHDHDPDKDRKWIKAGIEFVEGVPRCSTVARDRWADWSLSPLPAGQGGSGEGADEGDAVGVTIEMEKRARDKTLWVYAVGQDGSRMPMREVTWLFEDEEQLECWVGVYVCRPSSESGLGDLSVSFSQLEV
ncbi:hypothetical protein MGYG_03128 [Nannizzia gypsea CBS 118893]|uniref:Uncharacterized protein n=1 Tax=Arthroderma gypseum (strain ATCC MYA-4604 / CBS 118893) TaxID=535722 RepID=E4UR07_ARTGP|nr:hypothetical protein MGYG_03128 [Nannizzia gypsea CBS 118893]EFR00122.1 hypothetical protein MGYG_03128 [Nannizzia gypsea CBS 118893]